MDLKTLYQLKLYGDVSDEHTLARVNVWNETEKRKNRKIYENEDNDKIYNIVAKRPNWVGLRACWPNGT